MGRPKGLRKDPVTGKWYMSTEGKKPAQKPAKEPVHKKEKPVISGQEPKRRGRPKGSKNKPKDTLEFPVEQAKRIVDGAAKYYAKPEPVEEPKQPAGRKREKDFSWRRNDYTMVKTHLDSTYRPAIVQEITGDNVLVTFLNEFRHSIVPEKYLFTMGEAI